MTSEIELTRRAMQEAQKDMLNDPYVDGIRQKYYRLSDKKFGRFEAAYEAHLEALRKELTAKEPVSMKLVDILARELKAWPEGSLAATQDEDGQINHQMLSGTPVYSEQLCQWKAKPGKLLIFHCEQLTLSEDFKTAIVTHTEWQAAVDALNAPKVRVRGRLESRLSAMIEMGWLQPIFTESPEVPAYDFSLWPRERYDPSLSPSLYIQAIGRVKRMNPDEATPAADGKQYIINTSEYADHLIRGGRLIEPIKPQSKSKAEENTEFLEARVKELEARADAKNARIKDLESQLERLSAENESLSDIVVQLDDNAIQVLMRARDGDGLYFTSKEGQNVSVLRSGD